MATASTVAASAVAAAVAAVDPRHSSPDGKALGAQQSPTKQRARSPPKAERATGAGEKHALAASNDQPAAASTQATAFASATAYCSASHVYTESEHPIVPNYLPAWFLDVEDPVIETASVGEQSGAELALQEALASTRGKIEELRQSYAHHLYEMKRHEAVEKRSLSDRLGSSTDDASDLDDQEPRYRRSTRGKKVPRKLADTPAAPSRPSSRLGNAAFKVAEKTKKGQHSQTATQAEASTVAPSNKRSRPADTDDASSAKVQQDEQAKKKSPTAQDSTTKRGSVATTAVAPAAAAAVATTKTNRVTTGSKRSRSTEPVQSEQPAPRRAQKRLRSNSSADVEALAVGTEVVLPHGPTAQYPSLANKVGVIEQVLQELDDVWYSIRVSGPRTSRVVTILGRTVVGYPGKPSTAAAAAAAATNAVASGGDGAIAQPAQSGRSSRRNSGDRSGGEAPDTTSSDGVGQNTSPTDAGSQPAQKRQQRQRRPPQRLDSDAISPTASEPGAAGETLQRMTRRRSSTTGAAPTTTTTTTAAAAATTTATARASRNSSSSGDSTTAVPCPGLSSPTAGAFVWAGKPRGNGKLKYLRARIVAVKPRFCEVAFDNASSAERIPKDLLIADIEPPTKPRVGTAVCTFPTLQKREAMHEGTVTRIEPGRFRVALEKNQPPVWRKLADIRLRSAVPA